MKKPLMIGAAGILAAVAGLYWLGLLDVGQLFLVRYPWDPQVQSFSCTGSGTEYECSLYLEDRQQRCQAYGGAVQIYVVAGYNIPQGLSNAITGRGVQEVTLDGAELGFGYVEADKMRVDLPTGDCGGNYLPFVFTRTFTVTVAGNEPPPPPPECYSDGDCAVPAVAVDNGHYEARCIDGECVSDIVCDSGYMLRDGECADSGGLPDMSWWIVPAAVFMLIGVTLIAYLRLR